MRLSTPRIRPVAPDAATQEQRALLEGLPPSLQRFNIFTTMVRTPEALRRFNVWGAYIAGAGSSLSARERELAILRTVWLCRSEYEWAHHYLNALKVGPSEVEVGRVKVGALAPDWPARDAAILRTAEDIVRDHFVSEVTWASLDQFNETERMDLAYTVAQYVLASTIMNTFGVQLEDEYIRDADFPR